MKKSFFISVFIIFILPVAVNATGGGLRRATIKTCPNGVTYGLHSDGQGGTHWHVAVTNGNNYYASGEAIYSDPCPGYNKNQGTAGDTVGGGNTPSNSSSNTANTNGTSQNYSSNNSISNPTGNNGNSYTDNKNYNKNSNTTAATTVEKSNDNSIKKVTIDGKNVSASENMSFKTTKKFINIDIKTNDKKAKADFTNKELAIGENLISIIVIAENGDKKEYKLNINRVKGKGTASINEFSLNSEKIEFKDNKATFTKLKGDSSFEYSYKLSDKSAKLKLFLNDKEIKKLDNVQNKDLIKIVVIDKNDNENIYEIKIDEYSAVFSTMVYVVTGAILIAIFAAPAIIVLTILVIKKKIDLGDISKSFKSIKDGFKKAIKN